MSAKIYSKARRLLKSSKFFYVSLAVFVVQASWIALSGLYSMAFDENYHISIIRLYSHRLLPFWSHQPDGPATFGAVSRDPSYMYHYLLSFLYRFIEFFFHSETTQVIILRFVSIILFGLGIVIYRRVLLNTKASRALVNFVMAVFILTPVVPFLAAQINYDNLVFPLVAGALLLTQQFIKTLETDKILDLKQLFLLIIVCLFGSIVKYAFLPIFFGIFIFVIIKVSALVRRQHVNAVFKQTRSTLKLISKLQLVILVGLVVILSGLFMERYGVNTWRYGTPTPECDQVLGIERCKDNGSWLRNYLTHQDKLNHRLPPVSRDPMKYTVHTWLKQETNNLFYVINGSSSQFKTGQPYRLVRIFSVLIISAGTALFVWWQKLLRRKFKLNLLIVVMAIYLFSLWLQNYADFLHVGLAVAIQGRYLVPTLPIFYLLLGLGFDKLFNQKLALKVVSVIAALLILITQGGGMGVYILRSNASWYWPNPIVDRVNHNARRVLDLFVIGD